MEFRNMKALEESLESIVNDRVISCNDVLSIDDLSIADIELILDVAKFFEDCAKRNIKKTNLLRNISIVDAFFESSTRTRTSFEFAGKNLGADVVNISGDTSKKKGENMFDIVQVIDSMQVDIIAIRTQYSGLPQQIANCVNCRVINAGDGWHEHPSQALIDLFTIKNEFSNLKNKTALFIGDISKSRVFGSTARIMKKMGIKVSVVAPETMIPKSIKNVFSVDVFYNIEDALKNIDIVYALRVQNERGSVGDVPTLREYSKQFGISELRFGLANKNAILMHPGPVQRDIDIHGIFSTIHPQSRILKQVENGLHIRKALLYLLASRKEKKIINRV